MALKTNPYYINYKNDIGLPIADAYMALMFGSDEHAKEFIAWIEKLAKNTDKNLDKHIKRKQAYLMEKINWEDVINWEAVDSLTDEEVKLVLEIFDKVDY